LAIESRRIERLCVLSADDVCTIDGKARSLLRTTGIDAGAEPFLEIFSGIGAKVGQRGRVTFPERVIDDALDSVPNRVLLYGRGGALPLDLGGDKVYLGTGGAAVRILDLEDGRARDPTLDDLADLAWLVENLDNIDFFLRPVVARDIASEALDLCKFYTSLANTSKHVMGSVGSVNTARDVIELASLIAGGRDSLVERPIISFITSWLVSPLTLDRQVSNVLVTIAEQGIPVALSTAPVAGSTAPATLAGLLVQVHAEELSGIVLSQAIKKGAPVLYGPVPAVADFRTMGYAGGAIESALLNVACVQLADWIDVPIYADAGLTDSKLSDVQAGYEKGMNILLLAMAGGDYVHHSAGMLESMLTVSYEQYVIDNDIIGMAIRALQGIEISDQTLATSVIEGVGPGGHYLTHPHTLAHIRTDEYFVPATVDRQGRAAWEKKGAVDGRERARQIAREILHRERKGFILEDVDREIRNRFDLTGCLRGPGNE